MIIEQAERYFYSILHLNYKNAPQTKKPSLNFLFSPTLSALNCFYYFEDFEKFSFSS